MRVRTHVKAGLVSIACSISLFVVSSTAADEPADGENRRPSPDEAPPREKKSLNDALQLARRPLVNIRALEDYSYVVCMRERIAGELGDWNYLMVKVRLKPLSLRTFRIGPPDSIGRQVVYVQGENNDQAAVVRETISYGRFCLNLSREHLYNIRPDFPFEMARVCQKLVDMLERLKKLPEPEVTWWTGAEINKRACTCVQIAYSRQTEQSDFQVMRFFIDDELNLLTRFEVYGWPEDNGGPPVLTEEYTYLRLELNKGLSDSSFPTPERCGETIHVDLLDPPPRDKVDGSKIPIAKKPTTVCRPRRTWTRWREPLRKR